MWFGLHSLKDATWTRLLATYITVEWGATPVVGVHGNDDTAAAQATLPYAQVVAAAGRRILLCHSHYPDHAQELASRQGDDWAPKLDRWAELGRQAGATIVVYGHTHIPMALDHASVLLVNPGALASGNARTRQLRQTVALLAIRDDGAPVVVHVDLAEPARAYDPRLDLDAGFAAALARYSASILAPELERAWPRLVAAFSADEQALLRPVVLRVAHRCWAGLQETMSAADLRAEFQASADLPPALRARAEAALDDPPPGSR